MISNDFAQKTPEYIPFIEKFNKETNIIEQIGHNYSDFDEKTKILSILEYFTRHNIDAIVSSTKNNELIILTPECIKVDLPDGKKIITTENSEIRTSGRNHRKIFTIGLFKKILLKMDAIQLDDERYEVSLKNDLVEIVNGRGTSIPSRIKLNKIFFVNIDNVIIKDNKVVFNINDVKQLIPSISMHIKINATKEELKQYFEKKVD